MEQRKQLSFSWMVKSELMQELPKSKKEIIAELIVFMGVCGSLSLGNGIVFEVDKPSYAKRLYSHIKAIYGVGPKIHMKQFNRLGKSYKYIIRITEPEICQSILMDTGYINKAGEFNLNHGIKNSVVKNIDDRKSVLKCAFLLCGSVSSPEKHYHMELVFTDLKLADDITELINTSGLTAKTIDRKAARVVYIKGAENIVDFLTFIGATSSTLEFYNIKIIKETRNNVNRVVNCDTANIGKTLNAAARQLKSINIIKDKQGLNSLPKDLYEAAELRLLNPNMSLNDMAQMCTPIISKSGLNHRFKRIDRIARDLK